MKLFFREISSFNFEDDLLILDKSLEFNLLNNFITDDIMFISDELKLIFFNENTHHFYDFFDIRWEEIFNQLIYNIKLP